MYIKIFFYIEKLQTQIATENHKPVTNVAFKANSSDPVWSFS